MSADAFAQTAAQQAYWEVTVTCDSAFQTDRIIRQDLDGGDWCAKQFPDICHGQKKAAAELICGSSVDQALQEVEFKNQQAARQKQQVEQQKREIAQRQLLAKQRRLEAEKHHQELELRQAQNAKKEKAEQLAARPRRSILSGLSESDNSEQIKARIDLEQQLLEVEQKILENQRRLLSARQRRLAIEKLLSTR